VSRALDNALITAPEARVPELLQKLLAIAGRCWLAKRRLPFDLQCANLSAIPLRHFGALAAFTAARALPADTYFARLVAEIAAIANAAQRAAHCKP
jgi:hypothetical protein